jgi:AraC-like DNA-binding protein
MEDFYLLPPSPLLAAYVRHYWVLKTRGDVSAQVRTVPTGMMNLLFHRGTQLFSVGENVLHPRVFLGGQERTFADLKYDGQVNIISVVFRPVGARAFFNLPVDRITGLRLTADELEDKEFRELEKIIISTADDGVCIRLIEQFLLRRMTKPATHNLQRIDTAIRLINAGENDMALLAGAACLSTKQFTRVFSEYTGAHPKEFSRVIRFQRALHLLENDPQLNMAALACECGYFDQSHMIRDFKALSGYTPGEYLAACVPHSDYFG